ncbi:MAG: hypothetical protein BGO57_11490 [Sphingomonadales bacterium 63-6]|nr:MAG: hypothetical protein BGO57_11490 [Sphingomonadales bacterium 63-6]
MTAPLTITRAESTGSPEVLLLPSGKLANPAGREWTTFHQSWDDLPLDTWMADGGTYRRRRYAAFHVTDKECIRLPYRPHFQERDHNPLNGGVERWFAPMVDEQAEAPLFRDLVLNTAALIPRLYGQRAHAWTVEAHQFRIESLAGQPGQPTPEGMHHDGRDWVLILLMGGSNYTGGQTSVENVRGIRLLDHRLSRPGEALLLNDCDVRHGTTPIEAVTPGKQAWRDTLVLTFARAPQS